MVIWNIQINKVIEVMYLVRLYHVYMTIKSLIDGIFILQYDLIRFLQIKAKLILLCFIQIKLFLHQSLREQVSPAF